MSNQDVFIIIATAAVLISGVTVMAMQRAAGSSRKPRPAWARRLYPSGVAGLHMLVMGLTYAIYSLSLLLQPLRWHRTPAYHNLLLIMPAQTWGALFGGSAVLLLASAYQRRVHWLAYTAILLSVTLTSAWDVAFIVRWATSSSTTPETWTSWAIFNYVLVRAGMLIESERKQEVPAAGHDE
jgi:hypothetical protein